MIDFHAQTKEHIDEFGRTIVGVGPGSDAPPFFYTIGEYGKDLPELLLIGRVHPNDAKAILNLVAVLQEDAGTALSGDVSLGGEHPLRVAPLTGDALQKARDEYAIQAGRYYETDDIAVSQVILCDPKGRFPGDPEIEPKYDLPVL